MEYDNKNAKIYSRPRLIIPLSDNKKGRNNYQSTKKKINQKEKKIIIILIITLITAVLIINSMNPIIDKLCISEAENIATDVSNKQATEVMKRYTYDDLITVVRDKDNNIVMIQANTNTVNSIISEIPVRIINELKNKSNSNIYIYLGSILGLKAFSGSGYRITAKIANTSNVETTLKSEFTAAGINQTLHRIYLELKLDVSILTPYNIIDTSITNQVLLAESVIVGNVPNSYYNLNNASSGDSVRAIDK